MAVGFSRLQVSGYRRLRKLDLELRPLNVLIGANGVGKSSVLEVVSLLAASADGKLESAISDAGSLWNLVTSDASTPVISFCIQMQIPTEEPIKYEVDLAFAGLGYQVWREHLTQAQNLLAANPFKFIDSEISNVRYHDPNSKKLVSPNWEYRRLETALSQLPKMYQKPERFRRLLASASVVYHMLDVSPRAPIRQPQPVQPAEAPGIDGALLVAALYTMRETSRDRFEAVEDALRAAFPTFERLDFPPVASGLLSLAWKDRAFPRPFYPSQLSEGSLRFLWLATLLQSRGLGPVTMIDEPEVSLHPEMLRLLAELMREASERTQLIVTTHSDRFVRFLQPDELVVCDLAEDGGMTVKRGNDLDLDEWLKEYTLGELWTMGRLGGRS